MKVDARRAGWGGGREKRMGSLCAEREGMNGRQAQERDVTDLVVGRKGLREWEAEGEVLRQENRAVRKACL
jgi:hypothetical protein